MHPLSVAGSVLSGSQYHIRPNIRFFPPKLFSLRQICLGCRAHGVPSKRGWGLRWTATCTFAYQGRSRAASSCWSRTLELRCPSPWRSCWDGESLLCYSPRQKWSIALHWKLWVHGLSGIPCQQPQKIQMIMGTWNSRVPSSFITGTMMVSS